MKASVSIVRCENIQRPILWLAIFGLSLILTGGACGGDSGLSQGQQPTFDGGSAALDQVVPINESVQELCNQFDDYGDGEVDEDCPCEPGTSQQCYPDRALGALAAGSFAEEGYGECRMGTQHCEERGGGAEFGGRWGKCLGAVMPAPEICGDGLDQDCSGKDLQCNMLCETKPQEVAVQTLSFSNPGGCPWGQGDNKPSDREGSCYPGARSEQAETLDLPPGAVLCALEIDVPDQDMYFDDEVLLTFNDVVLLSSDSISCGAAELEQKNDLIFYDWKKLQCKTCPADEKSTYCLGQEKGLGSCELPSTSIQGMIQLSFANAITQAIGEATLDQGKYEFKVITTGDNDPGNDCRHSPFHMNVKVHYVR